MHSDEIGAPTPRAIAYSRCLAADVVGKPQRGAIHSVFKAAANIAFPTGLVISLNAAGSIRMANGVELATGSAAYPFPALRVQMPAILGAQRLIIDAIDCALDLSTCPQWDAQIERPPSTNMEVIRQHCERLRSHVSTEPLPHFPSIEAMARHLCGRGPGLTPSGDDILAGWMAMRWLLDGPTVTVLATCQQIIDIASGQTHLLSQCWLGYAARGQVAQPIAALLSALTMTTASDKQLDAAIQSMLSIGATSGRDLLTGMLLALDIASHVPSVSW